MDAGAGKGTVSSVLLLISLFMGLLPEVAFTEQPYVKSETFDIIHYDMTVHADPGAYKLSAMVSIDIQCSSTTPPDSLDFLLERPYKVTSVYKQDGTPISFERVTDAEPVLGLHSGSADRYDWSFLRIPSNLFASGDRQRIVVEYEGEKAIGMIVAHKEFRMHTDGARWYPYRYDDPATARCTVVTPDSVKAIFGGRRITVKEEEGGELRSEFRTEFPHNYFPLLAGMWEESRITDGDVELIFLHSAERAEDAGKLLERAAQSLRILSSSRMLGQYPYSQLVLVEYRQGFLGVGGIAMPGGIVAYVIESDSLEDWLRDTGEPFVHEISHLWWGASVFSKHDRDYIFLNEAFATYSAALLVELALGTDQMMGGFIGQRVRNYIPLLQDHDLSYSAGLNYGKGAYVVHLLRRVMGDDRFFLTIRKYLSDNRGHMVNLDVFREICETEYGKDLLWLFDQWVHRPGLPDLDFRYNIEHPKEGQSEITVAIDQKGEIYDLPITLSFRDEANVVKQKKSIWIHDRHEEWIFHLDKDVRKVSMNDDGWILTWNRAKTLYAYTPYYPSKKRIAKITVVMAAMVVLGYFIGRKRAQRKAVEPT